MEDSLNKLAKRINRKWNGIDRSLYWGDRLDVRYYLCWKLKSIKNKRILDIGCGPGIVLSELDNCNSKFGIDISERKINIAREVDKKGKFIVADISALPFKEQSFDIIILITTLYLAKDKEGLIKRIHGLLKDKGIFFLTALNRNHYYYRNNKSWLNFEETIDLTKKWFNCESFIGFNPFPMFPFFFPNLIADKIPLMWDIMLFMAKRKLFYSRSRGIFIKAIKKNFS
ncbi:MAG: class I SAM-dependent methyltransferase [Candidatus Omnitrophota bacterium]|nr:class I SAM-dependent methyltransferase [Candidatus Omnitrophota bacterium]